MIGPIVVLWVLFGGATGAAVGVCSQDGSCKKRLPPDQAIAAGILAALFCPLVLVGLLGLGLYTGLPWLGRGFTGLYRTVFPAKVKLPKAQVL